MENQLMVAVWMVTYNHGEFIENAIESVMMQKSTFKYKLFIGEDNSTDKTREICKKLEEKYTDRIELILHEKNIGANPNGLYMYKKCFESGAKYIALCEGDDYWADPLKLQKQVYFLEANKDYVLTFHKVKLLNFEGELLDDFITNVPEEHETIEDLARSGNYIHTPSVVFRNIIKEMPDEFKSSPIGDYFLYMLLTQFGRVKYFNESMAVYRLGVGIWSGENQNYKDLKTMECFSLINKIYFNKNNQVSDIFRNRIKIFFENYGNISFEVLENFNSNLIIKEMIYDIQISKKTNVFFNILSSTKTREIINELLKRIFKKLGITLK